MKVLYKDNPRTIVLYSTNHSLLFRQVNNKNTQESVVAIELIPNQDVKHGGFKQLIKREISGFLGFINVDDQVFLSFITGALPNVANPVEGESVDKIYSVDFVSLSKDTWDFATLDSNGMPVSTNATGLNEENKFDDDYNSLYASEPHPCNELKKLLSNGSFYYSNDFDLTSLLQNRGINNSQINMLHYSEEYMWNSFMMQELIRYRSTLDETIQTVLDDNKFMTTVIRGFAKTVKLNSRNDSITIISKQSWKRAGTRFNARGIDDNGHVANFVETEFIYNHVLSHSILSFMQVRGSVPAFWEQDSTLINPKITITRSAEATQPIFNSHFDNVCSKYGVCHIVNLLSKTKPPEIAVLNRYKQLYSNCDRKDELSYTEFDFHHETKQSGGFSGATKILPALYDSLEQFGWFSYDTQQQETVTRQDGVFRVNCLDCLDRTNLIEQVICQNVLEHIMNNERTGGSRFEVLEILAKYNSLWADNGDAISQIYTGTNALKSSFSRSGKMNLAGALSDVTKSVSRMYQNTFVDNKKQSTMDLLLGYDAKFSIPVRIYDPVSDYVQEKLKLKEHTFTSHKNILIFTGTLNVNATLPNPQFDLTSWLFPADNVDLPLPDIYAIGLQELIELNAGSILNADNSRPVKWAQLIEAQLNSQSQQYLLLRTESIASMTILFFVKKDQVSNVTHVSGSSKKTGLGGMTANKGACAVRFDFGATSFSLITSHLAAGVNATFERHNDYSTIMSGLTFVRNMNIVDHDHIIWFGDLNYRINLPNDQVRSMVSQAQFNDLFEADQLNHEMKLKNGAFKGFDEAPIIFHPTYKYDKGTSNYDTSEKQRVPSWTDRILSRTQGDAPPLGQLNYNSLMDIEISDHKPVYATFHCNVKFIDENMKQQLAKQIYDDYKQQNGGHDEMSLFKKDSQTSFATNTLSELNLLDDFDEPAPPTPVRPATYNGNLPRRVPPPPTTRRATELEKKASTTSKLPRKLPPKPTEIELTDSSIMDLHRAASVSRLASTAPAVSPPAAAPAPPPARKTTVPIGFSSTPLIPSRSASNTPRATPPIPATASEAAGPNNVPVSASTPALPIRKPATPPLSSQTPPLAKSLTHKVPVVPKKPSQLTGSKVDQDTTQTQPKPTAPAVPPRNEKTMSDWKPLVPK